MDWCAWKIVRLPLSPFYLSQPFFISTALVSIAGYLFVPFLNALKIRRNVRKKAPVRHFKKRATPTMGGLFVIPIGVGVAKFTAGFSSIEVSGATVATLAFASIGLLDDILSFAKNNNHGLSSQIKLFLEVRLGELFVPTWPKLLSFTGLEMTVCLYFTGSCWDLVCFLVGHCKYILSLIHI